MTPTKPTQPANSDTGLQLVDTEYTQLDGGSLWVGDQTGKWYFSDETADFHGPFDTMEGARKVLADYIQHL